MALDPFLLTASRATWLIGWTLLFYEGAARCGAGPLRWLRRRPVGPLGRAGAGSLLGWFLFGSALFGLAAVGLFRPVPIVALAVACAFASREAVQPRLLWGEAARAAWNLGWPWLIALGAGLSPFLLAAMTPGIDKDSLDYHLGVPWAWLQAGRCFGGDVPYTIHLPLPIDLGHVLPILLSDHRLGKCLVAGSLLCGAACWAERCRERGRIAAAWSGPLFAMSAGVMLVLLNTAKNDMAACQLFLVGACLTLDGAWLAGAAFLGCALAAKLVFGPQILVWLLVLRPPRKLMVPVAVLVGLPVLPWCAAAWIFRGNPVFPFAAGVFGQFDWTVANQAVFDTYARGLWEAGMAGWREIIPGGWFRFMAHEHTLLLLAWPGLVWLRRTRAVAVACLLGGWATLVMGHMPRYVIPAIVLLSYLVAEESARWVAGRRLAGTTLLVGYALTRIALSSVWQDLPWSDAWRPQAGVRELGTYGEAVQHLRTLDPRRLITVGDSRLHLLPGRILYGGWCGETPLIWKVAKASRTPGDMRRKFRQMGSRHLLYNYVSSAWLEIPYLPFTWTDRDLGAYMEFCRRYLVPVWHSERSDYVHGGFYLFELAARPLAHPSAVIWFAPGTEALHGEAALAHQEQRTEDALAATRQVARRLPDVLHVRNQCGHYAIELEDYAAAFADLAPGVRAGMMDFLNFPEFGTAALQLRRIDLAQAVLEQALPRYPDFAGQVRLVLGQVHLQRAYAAYDGRDAALAWAELDHTFAVLDGMTRAAELAQGAAVRRARALAHGLLGELRLVHAQREGAIREFERAVSLAPDLPQAERWKAAMAGHP